MEVLGILLPVTLLLVGIWAIWGAFLLLLWSMQQGFIGFVAYVAAWAFLFPAMAIFSIARGFSAFCGTLAEQHRANKARQESLREKGTSP